MRGLTASVAKPDRQSRFRRAPSMAVDITALYCCLDDFCKVFEDWEAHRLLPSVQTRQRSGKLSRSEMLFIMVLFHLSPFKHFKVFYRYGIGQQHRACFRELPHYDRFVGLIPRLFAPLMVLLHNLSGAQTGIYFADSTKLAVCHNRRIHRHKVFEGLAARGKTSMGWFYGLKLHFVINHKGQIMAVKITPGNTADSTVLDAITRPLAGKLYAAKGYIGQELFKTLWQRGLHLITGIRRNMRNYLMPMADKIMRRKRFVIETVLSNDLVYSARRYTELLCDLCRRSRFLISLNDRCVSGFLSSHMNLSINLGVCWREMGQNMNMRKGAVKSPPSHLTHSLTGMFTSASRTILKRTCPSSTGTLPR